MSQNVIVVIEDIGERVGVGARKKHCRGFSGQAQKIQNLAVRLRGILLDALLYVISLKVRQQRSGSKFDI